MLGKLVIIGLDGATNRILVPLADEGVIPNIKSLMDNGCRGNLISTFPPLTSPAWATLMTGKLPGKIGLFGFKDHISKTYEPGLINSTSIKAKMFWEMAGDSGKKVCVLNFPLTYPVRKANGAIISGFLTPDSAADFFYPETLSEELCGYPLQGRQPDQVHDFEAFYKDLFSEMEKRHAYLLKIARRENPDLLMYCIQETDSTHHRVAKFLYPQFNEYHGAMGSRVRDLNKKMYSIIDGIIGELISISGRNSTFLIASDHGSAPSSKYALNMNKLLSREGFIKSNLGGLLRILYKNTRGGVQAWFRKQFPNKTSLIDYTKTYAWCESYRCISPGIFVNLMGRFPEGIVNPGAEYDSLIDKIILLLESLEHDGKKIVDRIYKRDMIYNGPFKDYAPDLTFTMHPDYDVPVTKLKKNLKRKNIIEVDELTKHFSGTHKFNGTYVISGPHIKNGGSSTDVSIDSIAPTTLHLLGLPVPDDMDGKVMTHVFEDWYLIDQPVVFQGSSEFAGEGYSLKDEEKTLLEAQLKALGYM